MWATMAAVWYFAYGSNMSPTQMGERCPGHGRGYAARLAGYRLAFDRYSAGRGGGHVADIVQASDTSVWGVVWEVEEHHLEALDGFEGVARGAYQRTHVEVEVRGEQHAAVAYQVCEPGGEGPPSPIYLGLLLQGAAAFALPDEYVGFLRTHGGDSS